MTSRAWLVVGWLLCATSLAAESDVPAAARALGFGEGEHPVRTALDPKGALATAAACGDCHERVYARWRASAHASAWSNPLFQAGFAREPVSRCVHCHAPREEQRAEVFRVMPRGSYPEVRAELLSWGAVPLSPRALAQEGVDCQSCHVRQGQIWTASDVGVDDHVQRPEAAALGSADVCAGCHEFQFNGVRRGRMVLSGTLVQSTYSEWRAWGGKETCLDCHAKGDPHALEDTHDLAFLRGALEVSVREGALVLASRGVGHRFPTGDLFRHLTVELFDGKRWSRVASLGRQYESKEDPAIGGESMALASDTSLVPGVPRAIPLPSGALRYRITYHYVSDVSEQRGDVAPGLARVVLARGELAAAPRRGSASPP